MTALLADTAHRPWPLPDRPWAMAMVWHDLLFMHWPIPVAQLRPHIPEALEIDTFEGQAWLGVVPFRMSGVRPRLTPPLPWLSAFPELNVRTYVKRDERPGVWFFSLDAANPVAVRAARWSFHLPYFDARMSLDADGERIPSRCQRTHKGALSADFQGWYRPLGEVFKAEPGSLDAWLVERYCLYAADRQGRVSRGEIHHGAWPLQRAEAECSKNTMARAAGLALADREPVLHFAREIEVVSWLLERV